jgi:hypothetical protein
MSQLARALRITLDLDIFSMSDQGMLARFHGEEHSGRT